MRGLKIGLALGGGGARGFSHIGVLKVLEKEGIPLDLIVGTSMGSIIGGLYALLCDAKELEQRVCQAVEKTGLRKIRDVFPEKEDTTRRQTLLRKVAGFVKELYLWNLHFRKKWVVSEDQIDRELSELLGGREFSDTVIQFAACAADVKTGEEVVLNKGSLVRSILASCAIPGVFPPVELGGRLLVDGGVLGSVPTDAVRGLGAGFIIAVDVERELKFDRFEYGIDILLQCEAIRAFELKRIKLKGADVVIRPNVTHVAWPHFSKIKECIEAGEVATWEALPKIRELLRKKRRKLFIKRLFWPF